MGATVAPPRTLSGKLPQAIPQGTVIDSPSGLVTLCRAVLASDLARPTLREPETILKHQDRGSATRRAQKFPGMRMLASLVVSGLVPTVAGPGHGALDWNTRTGRPCCKG